MTKIIFIFLISLNAFSADYISGVKSEFDLELQRVYQSDSKALIPDQQALKGGYNSLVSYVKPAPDQEDAGSCLFMSHTGAVEVLLNQLRGPRKSYDLSERFFMNLQKEGVADEQVVNWRTDTIYRLNKLGYTYKNKDYRFTKGWYKTVDERRVVAQENEESADYGVKFNWISLYKNLTARKVRLPKFSREVLYADPDENQWNILSAPKNIVNELKDAIKKNNAPAVVIYNHTGFWHAVTVVGFNDKASSDNCYTVRRYPGQMYERAAEIDEEASVETDAERAAKLRRKAKKFRQRGDSIAKAHKERGCRGKGVFYVRDSIYPDENMPLYDYDFSTSGEEEFLNAPIILRDYEWLELLANHVVLITVSK